MSIYNATELRKKFQKWFEQNPGEHKEFYRDTLKKYNKGVEASVRTAINSKLKKFTGALASSVKTNSGFGAGGSVYVTTYISNVPQEVQHVWSDSTKHGRYQWYAPGYAGFVNWGTKSHPNRKKSNASKLNKKIERQAAQIAKYRKKLSEHKAKMFLSARIRMTGVDKTEEKYNKIIDRYTAQMQKTIEKARKLSGLPIIHGVTARKILAYLEQNQDTIAQKIYNDIYNRIEQDLSR